MSDATTDLIVDPEAERQRDARRAAWETGFSVAADRVERGEVGVSDFPATVRPGVERELQSRRDLADDAADADAMSKLYGFGS